MDATVLTGLLIPFAGTSLGAACLFFVWDTMNINLQKALIGFAAGVMVVATVWSLLIPALEQSAQLGQWSFVPAAVGFWLGILFLLVLDRAVPYMHLDNTAEDPHANLKRTTMLVLTVTLHNIPEDMAVGVVYAGWVSGTAGITAAARALAIQNFPEGAIISMPLWAEGRSEPHAFWYGVASGVVEPIAGGLNVLAAGLVTPVLPYLRSFAAGAMIYVLVEELVPEMAEGEHSNAATILFAAGFTLMVALDVALE